MATSKVHEITLHLDDIQQLFQAPELDPFSGHDHSLSGMEQILNELKPKSLMRPVRTIILLRRTHPPEDIEQNCRLAVQKFCAAQIHQITNELAALRRQGIKALQTGLLFLAVCLLLSTLFDGLETLPKLLRRFLSEGFLIAGWVSLWHPTELLLYEWLPYRRDIKLYERIKNMELVIRAEG